ncbi:MAG TPA: uroporphyrinogen decarboxylase family protein, partial [Planctomycetota bacterium]|nr:uroporphyrinogen decarboxylase family protein [Planctomycetota bacterium]
FTQARELEAKLGDRGLALVQILSPLCHRAGSACAMEDLMVWYHTDRGLFDAVFDLFRDQMLEEARLTLAAGFRHVFANYYFDSLSVGWSPRIWEDVFQPALAALCDIVHAAGGLVNFYDDGKMSGILELAADAGVDVVQTLTPPPVGDVDLADAKRRVGDRVSLMGYVDLLYVLKMGTPALVERTVREAMEVAAPGGGFILGTSDSIREGTPEANIRAYFDAAMKYGSVR